MTNFDLLLDMLPPDYHTPERIDYLKTKYMDKLNETTNLTSDVLKMCVDRIRAELTLKFPIEYEEVKVEPKKEEHNWWDD